MWKAFAELQELGWIDARRPRMVCVQSDGCAPIVRAFHAGESSAAPWEHAETFALGLRVPAAIGDFLMLRALRDSGGDAVAVSDGEIGVAGRDLALREGIFPAPEGAATWAAALRLRDVGRLDSRDTVVLFNTGGWYKYADGWRRALGL
jgi:threonine synthase